MGKKRKRLRKGDHYIRVTAKRKRKWDGCQEDGQKTKGTNDVKTRVYYLWEGKTVSTVGKNNIIFPRAKRGSAAVGLIEVKNEETP